MQKTGFKLLVHTDPCVSAPSSPKCRHSTFCTERTNRKQRYLTSESPMQQPDDREKQAPAKVGMRVCKVRRTHGCGVLSCLCHHSVLEPLISVLLSPSRLQICGWVYGRMPSLGKASLNYAQSRVVFHTGTYVEFFLLLRTECVLGFWPTW